VDSRYGYTNSAQDASVSPLSDVWTDAHPNDVAALLKQFLRELPDPLLTTEYLDAFQSCGRKCAAVAPGVRCKRHTYTLSSGCFDYVC